MKNVISSLIYAIVATSLLMGVVYSYATYTWINTLGVLVIFILWVLYPKFHPSDLWLRDKK